jgi:hypothetical protein
MNKCEIENVNIRAGWKFNQMLTEIFSVGTEPFAYLVKQLKPFGITSRSITIENPSYNLGDVSFIVDLVNPRVRVTVNYDDVEFVSNDVQAEDVLNILKIMSVVFESLEKLDTDIKDGIGQSKITFHLSLKDKNVEEYLSERVSTKLDRDKTIPEAIVFVVKGDEISEKFLTRAVVAKSESYANALFLELSYQIHVSPENFKVEKPMEFFDSLKAHYESVFALLDIEVIESEPEEN